MNHLRAGAVVAGGLVLLAAVALLAWRFLLAATPITPPLAAAFVGAQACAGCHRQGDARWSGSDHARAMQVANETTVLGDFANRRFTYGAVTSTFFRRDGRFMVRTDGPDGKLADFGIKYTFGVRPLQQYLIERPGGRLQALSVAWAAIRRISGRTTTRRRIATQRHGRRSPWPAKPATAQALGARAAYERAAADYVAAQRTNADRPEYRTNLGTFFAARRRVSDAEAELRAAIALDWTFVPAYVNLADLYRAERREPDVRRVLEDGLQAVPDDATLHHAFGLALVRAQRTAEALRHIERAAARAPDNPRFVYTYAVGLNSAGRPREAITVLEKALPRIRTIATCSSPCRASTATRAPRIGRCAMRSSWPRDILTTRRRSGSSRSSGRDRVADRPVIDRGGRVAMGPRSDCRGATPDYSLHAPLKA